MAVGDVFRRPPQFDSDEQERDAGNDHRSRRAVIDERVWIAIGRLRRRMIGMRAGFGQPLFNDGPIMHPIGSQQSTAADERDGPDDDQEPGKNVAAHGIQSTSTLNGFLPDVADLAIKD